MQQLVRQLALRLDHRIDFLLQGTATNELVNQNVLRLPHTERTVRCLVFDGRVPPAVEMHDVRCRGQVKPGAAGLQGKHEEAYRLILLKAAHQILALLYLGIAMQYKSRAFEDGAEKISDRASHLAKLSEDEHLLLPGRHDFGNVSQPRPLATFTLFPRPVSQPL